MLTGTNQRARSGGRNGALYAYRQYGIRDGAGFVSAMGLQAAQKGNPA